MVKDRLEAYAKDLAARMMRSDFDTLAKFAELLLETKRRGGTVFLAGNGGSAATASHVTNDLLKGCRRGDEPGFRAICLNDSSTLLTCLANDYAYEDVYAILLETYAKKDDVLVLFSGSGNSPNVVKAAEKARQMSVRVVGFGGRDGGRMKPLCDLAVIAPTDSMEMLEDFHLVYFHDLACTLQEELGCRAACPGH